MSLVLNTNIDSLVAQNSLTSSGSQLSSALQQLSSGLRINTPADDAAGYAITQGMTSQIGGLNQAAQNASAGVSLTQTASGALQEVTSDLQSMRDLAVESLNATNSAQDRADLDTQFQQLKADINQVSQTANFNGVNLLDGTFQGATFQIGANAGQTITVASVASSSASNLGTLNTLAGIAPTANTTAAGDSGYITISPDLTVNPTDAATVNTASFTLTGNAATDAKTVAAAINQISGQDGGLIATVNANGGIDLNSTTAQTVGAITFTGTTAAGVATAYTTDDARPRARARCNSPTSRRSMIPTRRSPRSTPPCSRSPPRERSWVPTRTASRRPSRASIPIRPTLPARAAASRTRTTPRPPRSCPRRRSCSRPARRWSPRPTRCRKTF